MEEKLLLAFLSSVRVYLRGRRDRNDKLSCFIFTRRRTRERGKKTLNEIEINFFFLST